MQNGSRIQDFALYPQISEGPTEVENASEEKEMSQSEKLIDKLHSRRMLTVLADRNVYDMAKHNYSPIGISYRDGRIAHALGGSLFVGSTTTGENMILSQDVGFFFMTPCTNMSLLQFYYFHPLTCRYHGNGKLSHDIQ